MANYNKLKLIILILFILSIALNMFVINNYYKQKKIYELKLEQIINSKVDSSYINVIDSIKYNIKERDSIIYKIKYKYEDSIIKANSLDDSSSVKLFKRLVSE